MKFIRIQNDIFNTNCIENIYKYSLAGEHAIKVKIQNARYDKTFDYDCQKNRDLDFKRVSEELLFIKNL